MDYQNTLLVNRKRAALIFEDIIRDGVERPPIFNMLHLYLGLSEIFPVISVMTETQRLFARDKNIGSLSNWPPDLRKFWLNLNQVFLNPELPLEKKQNRIYNSIKNKYLAYVGIRYPRRA